MSKRADSILMWGHYCQGHCGLVIGFDSSSDVFRKHKGLREVNYVTERVLFDANWKPGSVAFGRFGDEIILSKNTDWSYEKELRQIFPLSELKAKKFQDGTVAYFLSLPPAAITRVILGARVSADVEGAVKSALRNNSLSHVRFLRAALHESSFALTFK